MSTQPINPETIDSEIDAVQLEVDDSHFVNFNGVRVYAAETETSAFLFDLKCRIVHWLLTSQNLSGLPNFTLLMGALPKESYKRVKGAEGVPTNMLARQSYTVHQTQTPDGIARILLNAYTGETDRDKAKHTTFDLVRGTLSGLVQTLVEYNTKRNTKEFKDACAALGLTSYGVLNTDGARFASEVSRTLGEPEESALFVPVANTAKRSNPMGAVYVLVNVDGQKPERVPGPNKPNGEAGEPIKLRASAAAIEKLLAYGPSVRFTFEAIEETKPETDTIVENSEEIEHKATAVAPLPTRKSRNKGKPAQADETRVS